MAKTKPPPSKKLKNRDEIDGQAVPCLEDMDVDELRERLVELMSSCRSTEQLVKMVEAVERIAEEDD